MGPQLLLCNIIFLSFTARVVISQSADRKSGITKRTILIGTYKQFGVLNNKQ